MKIYITAILKTKPEFRGEMLSVFDNMIRNTRNETGCELYRLHQNESDRDTFVFYEIWKDPLALDLHNRQQYILEFVKLAGEKLQEKPEIIKMSLL